MINKNDNIYVKKPEIVEKIEYKYTIPENKHYISQDNRPEYKKKQDQSNAQLGYNKYIEDKKIKEGTEKLIGFMNFLDYAGLATGAMELAKKGLTKGIKMAVKGAAKGPAKKSIDNLSKSTITKLTPTEISVIKGGSKYSTPQAAKVEEYVNPDELKRRFIKFIGEVGDETPVDRSILYNKQMSKLRERGINTFDIKSADYKKALDKRESILRKTAPEGRTNIITYRKNEPDAQSFVSKDIYKDKNGEVANIGITEFKRNGGDFNGAWVENYNKIPGEGKVQERGINSGLKFTKEINNTKGITVGDDLMSPEKTEAMLKHFRGKEKTGEMGEARIYGSDGFEVNRRSVPIYRIFEPSDLKTRTKSTVFDPTILDKDGNMKVDWNNPDIFKIIGLPLIMKGAGDEK